MSKRKLLAVGNGRTGFESLYELKRVLNLIIPSYTDPEGHCSLSPIPVEGVLDRSGNILTEDDGLL